MIDMRVAQLLSAALTDKRRTLSVQTGGGNRDIAPVRSATSCASGGRRRGRRGADDQRGEDGSLHVTYL